MNNPILNKMSLIWRSWPIRIFLLALLARLIYIAALKYFYLFYDHPSSDVTYYQNWAEDIILGKRPPQVYYGLPLYPYFLALLKLLTLGNTLALKLAYLAIGSFNCVLAFWLARKMLGDKVAKLTGLLCAFNFVLMHYDWLMMPVTLIITLSLSIILLYDYLEPRKRKEEWFILGSLVGLTSLGDGKFLLFAVFLVLYILKTFKKELIVIKPYVIYPFILGVLLVLGVTMLRNRLVGGDWIMVSAQSGLSFYVGNNPAATGTFENPDFIRPTHEGQDADQRIMAEQTLKRSLKPSEVSAFWSQQALSFIINSPLQYLDLLRNKFVAFFSDSEAAYDLDLLFQKNWKKFLDINSYLLIAPLGILGIVLLGLRKREIALTLYLIVSQLIFTLIFFLTHRHRATILPFLIIFESYALLWLWEKYKNKNYKRTAVALLFCIVFMIVFWPQPLKTQIIDFLKFSKTGAILEKKGKFKEAREQYTNALKINPHDATLYVNLGNSYAQEELYSLAIDYYTKALKISPHYPEAFYNLAFSYEKLHDFKTAVSLYNHVLTLEPSNYSAHFRLGLIYQMTGDCSAARHYFEESIRLMPSLKSYISSFIKNCPA